MRVGGLCTVLFYGLRVEQWVKPGRLTLCPYFMKAVTPRCVGH
jgi:hypothetical protein